MSKLARSNNSCFLFEFSANGLIRNKIRRNTRARISHVYGSDEGWNIKRTFSRDRRFKIYSLTFIDTYWEKEHEHFYSVEFAFYFQSLQHFKCFPLSEKYTCQMNSFGKANLNEPNFKLFSFKYCNAGLDWLFCSNSLNFFNYILKTGLIEIFSVDSMM